MKVIGKTILPAVISGVALVAAYLLEWPPFANPPQAVEESTAEPFPDKPPFRFSSRALQGICDQYGIDCPVLAERMKSVGIEASPVWSIKQIAEKNDMSTEAVFNTIRQLKN